MCVGIFNVCVLFKHRLWGILMRIVYFCVGQWKQRNTERMQTHICLPSKLFCYFFFLIFFFSFCYSRMKNEPCLTNYIEAVFLRFNWFGLDALPRNLFALEWLVTSVGRTKMHPIVPVCAWCIRICNKSKIYDRNLPVGMCPLLLVYNFHGMFP